MDEEETAAMGGAFGDDAWSPNAAAAHDKIAQAIPASGETSREVNKAAE